MSAVAHFDRLTGSIRGYEGTLDRVLVLHAGRSVMSPAARALLGSRIADGDLAGRPKDWGAQNTRSAAEAIEAVARELSQRLFGTAFVDYRALSGSLANGLATAALTRPGDTILMPPEWAFGHKSLGREGYPGAGGRRVVDMPWDPANLGPDLDGLRRLLRAERPRLVILGLSRILFPDPFAEIVPLAREVGATLVYDAAHVLGLIAGGAFPNPITAGFDLMTGSTHKTLPGPTGGAVLAANGDDLEAVGKLGDAWLSTYGHARVASLAWTLAELSTHGAVYAREVIGNARALGAALADGFTVIGASRGFTETHQVIVDLTGVIDGSDAARRLAAASILVNPPTPVDARLRNGEVPGLWLRFGTSAVTRFGMGEGQMKEIGALLVRLLLTREEPAAVGKRVEELVAAFNVVRYTTEPNV